VIARIMQAVRAGEITVEDLGLWSFLSWESDRSGVYSAPRKATAYSAPRKATASQVGFTERQLRASFERLASIGAIVSLTKKGSRKARWGIKPKFGKQTQSKPEIKGSVQGDQKTEKPDALKHLPF